MAVAAGHPTARMGPRVDGEPGVIEDCSQPGCRGVAGRAGRWKVRRHMVGIVGAQVIRLVTRVAVGGRALVYAVDVTLRARHGDVRAGQRESGLVMVELRSLPGAGGVADLAVGGKASRLVVRIGGAVVVIEVARHARGRQVGEVPIHVAGDAGERSVLAGERELRLGVVEASRSPSAGRMANRAIGRKSGQPCGWGWWFCCSR